MVLETRTSRQSTPDACEVLDNNAVDTAAYDDALWHTGRRWRPL
jgi:hypothetical protein